MMETMFELILLDFRGQVVVHGSPCTTLQRLWMRDEVHSGQKLENRETFGEARIAHNGSRSFPPLTYRNWLMVDPSFPAGLRVCAHNI
jgi:hypothetical protein